MKEVVVDTLIIEEDRPAHIAKHNIVTDEVLEVLAGDYVYIAGRENRWIIFGKTVRKIFLTIVVGERLEENTYGLITARPARRNERSFYITLGSVISISPLHSMNSKGLETNFLKPLSNDFNRLGEK